MVSEVIVRHANGASCQPMMTRTDFEDEIAFGCAHHQHGMLPAHGVSATASPYTPGSKVPAVIASRSWVADAAPKTSATRTGAWALPPAS